MKPHAYCAAEPNLTTKLPYTQNILKCEIVPDFVYSPNVTQTENKLQESHLSNS